MNRISALIRDYRELSSPFLHVRTQQEDGIDDAGSGPSLDTEPTAVLIDQLASQAQTC